MDSFLAKMPLKRNYSLLKRRLVCSNFALRKSKYYVSLQSTLKLRVHLEFRSIFVLYILKIVTFCRRKVSNIKRALRSDVMTWSSAGSTIKKV